MKFETARDPVKEGPVDLTWDDAFALWIERHPQLRPTSVTRYTDGFHHFTKYLGDRALTPSVARGMVAKMREDGISDASISMAFRMCRSIIRLIQDLGHDVYNPLVGMRLGIDVSVRRTSYITESEYRRLLFQAEQLDGHARMDMLYIVEMGWNTGARLGDVIGMRWQSVDMDAGVISFVQQKVSSTKKDPSCVVPMDPGAGHTLILRQLWNERPSGSQPSDFIRPRLGSNVGAAKKVIERFMCRAGVAKTYHDFRRSMYTRYASAGIDRKIVAALMGSNCERIVDGYIQKDPHALWSARETLNRHEQEQKNTAHLRAEQLASRLGSQSYRSRLFSDRAIGAPVIEVESVRHEHSAGRSPAERACAGAGPGMGAAPSPAEGPDGGGVPADCGERCDPGHGGKGQGGGGSGDPALPG